MMRSCSLHSRTSSALTAIASVMFLSLGAACSATPGPGGGDGLPLGTGGTGPAISPECTETPACSGAEFDKNGNPAVCVQTVDADVVNESGDPAAGFFAQVCAANICKNAKADEQGHLHIVVCKNMVNPAFKIPGKSKYGSIAVPVTESIMALGTYKLVPLSTGATQLPPTLDKDTTFTSGGAVLTLTAGTEVKINEVDHPDPEDQMFRAAYIPTDGAPGLAESSPNLELFYGLAPTGTKLSKGANLTVPNFNKWPSGAQVQFFVQGMDPAGGVNGPAGQWTQAGDGRVSDDGKTISTSSSIKYLSLIGVGLK